MSKKLKDYSNTQTMSEEAKAEKILEPDPEINVATGEEETPVSGAPHAEGMKHLWDKSKKNRDLVQRADSEGDTSVERINRLVAEAAGGEIPEEQIDTNMPDRFAADRGEETEEQYTARLIQEQQDAASGDEPEQKSEKIVEGSAADALPAYEEQGTVEVTILGRTLEVPQQDIDDAGGIEAYQKNRSATIKLQRAATLEKKAKALLTSNETDTTQDGVQIADPSSDGLSEADINSLHEEMMDEVINGTEDEMKAWIAKKLTPQTVIKPEPSPTVSQEEHENVPQEELNEEYEADRVDANTMMQEDFPDIMVDPELLGLAKQRFSTILSNPNNEGRSQKEMAREAANFVRGLGNRLNRRAAQPDPVEQERQTRIERKRALPHQSRADQKGASQAPKEKHITTRREHFLRLRRRAGHDLAE